MEQFYLVAIKEWGTGALVIVLGFQMIVRPLVGWLVTFLPKKAAGHVHDSGIVRKTEAMERDIILSAVGECSKKIDTLIVHVQKVNGRVTRNEQWREDHEKSNDKFEVEAKSQIEQLWTKKASKEGAA